MRSFVSLLAFGVVLPFSTWSNEPLAKSGPHQVHLLELYSTQSCSSCPPANRWFSELKNHSNLYKSFVPVLFHVDYWDHLGWKDPYSNRQYSQRQRQYARSWKANKVYTPEFVLDGKEWRSRNSSELGASNKLGGLLQIFVNSTKRKEFRVSFQNPSLKTMDLRLHVALQGSKIRTAVKAGENRGKNLEHDFLVLNYQSFSLKRDKDGLFSKSFSLEDPFEGLDAPRSLSIWVSQDKDMSPIQALGLDLKKYI